MKSLRIILGILIIGMIWLWYHLHEENFISGPKTLYDDPNEN